MNSIRIYDTLIIRFISLLVIDHISLLRTRKPRLPCTAAARMLPAAVPICVDRRSSVCREEFTVSAIERGRRALSMAPKLLRPR